MVAFCCAVIQRHCRHSCFPSLRRDISEEEGSGGNSWPRKWFFQRQCQTFFFFAQKYQGGYFSVAFISSKKSTVAELRDHFLSTLHYPGLRAIFWLISAEFVIMDSAEWISGGKYQLAASGKLVQIWHGAPLKEIELPLHQRRLARLDFLSRLFLQFQKKITGRYPDHFAVVSTSKFFTKRAFSSAFRASHYVEAGYSRNDAIFEGQGDLPRTSPLWINCDLKVLTFIDKARSEQLKVIFMPRPSVPITVLLLLREFLICRRSTPLPRLTVFC